MTIKKKTRLGRVCINISYLIPERLNSARQPITGILDFKFSYNPCSLQGRWLWVQGSCWEPQACYALFGSPMSSESKSNPSTLLNSSHDQPRISASIDAPPGILTTNVDKSTGASLLGGLVGDKCVFNAGINLGQIR